MLSSDCLSDKSEKIIYEQIYMLTGLTIKRIISFFLFKHIAKDTNPFSHFLDNLINCFIQEIFTT